MKKVITSTRIGNAKIMKLQDGVKVYLPPIRKTDRKAQSHADFYLLGRAIVGNLGFAELATEVSEIRHAPKKSEDG